VVGKLPVRLGQLIHLAYGLDGQVWYSLDDIGRQHAQAGIQNQQWVTDGRNDILEVFSLNGIRFFKQIVHATSSF
jgi:hypothetical protein